MWAINSSLRVLNFPSTNAPLSAVASSFTWAILSLSASYLFILITPPISPLRVFSILRSLVVWFSLHYSKPSCSALFKRLNPCMVYSLRPTVFTLGMFDALSFPAFDGEAGCLALWSTLLYLPRGLTPGSFVFGFKPPCNSFISISSFSSSTSFWISPLTVCKTRFTPSSAATSARLG